MIVCLCHRVSDRDIRRAAACGIDCFDVLQDETRVASSCGCCLDTARDVFEAARGACACSATPHAERAAATAFD